MIDPFEELMRTVTDTSRFPPNSRYHGFETRVLETPVGRAIRYLCRRFVPLPDARPPLQEHVVTAGDRLDNLAHRYLGDPELFWRLADANTAMRPADLTAPSQIGRRRLRIPLPDGIPGPRDA
jgi:hypothetical protein